MLNRGLNILCLRDGIVPLINGNLAAALTCFQAGIGFLVRRLDRCSAHMPGTLAVRTDLPTGARSLIRRDIVAVADIVSGGEQKIFAAVVTAPRRVARFECAKKVCAEKIAAVFKYGSLR